MIVIKKLIAISAGHFDSKKENSIIRKRIHYLNYGLLGLATILKHKGNIDIIVFQADYYDVEGLFETIMSTGISIDTDCSYFLLSIPSYYSMSWAKHFCEYVYQNYQKPIIVGGRWVVDNHTDWIKNQLKYVDIIIEGFGERKLAQFFNLPGWEKIPDGSSSCFEWIDYKLLHDYKKYQPCIEISRGCGAGCQFCADRDNKRLRNKPVGIVLRELEYLDEIYNDYSVYFEAPHFVFERAWIENLCENLVARNHLVSWRCTSRVETVPTELLGIMRDAGLKVLDIGLESASVQQLVNMKKTKYPEKYLETADMLLSACSEHGIWVKFNLLLYAGETYETVDETIQWLLKRKKLIKDVSVSSLVYYYNMDSINELYSLGASIPDGENIFKTGYVDLNLSRVINRQMSKKLTVDIPKLIANQRDFYDIKSISYFEPGYTYSEYLEDIKMCNYKELPFSIDLDA